MKLLIRTVGLNMFALLTVVSISQLAHAGELRILDTNGLIRVIKDIEKPVTITVVAQTNAPTENVLLSNTNGLAADIGATRTDQHTIIFKDVAEGVWKIDAHGQPLTVKSIDVN